MGTIASLIGRNEFREGVQMRHRLKKAAKKNKNPVGAERGIICEGWERYT